MYSGHWEGTVAGCEAIGYIYMTTENPGFTKGPTTLEEHPTTYKKLGPLRKNNLNVDPRKKALPHKQGTDEFSKHQA